MKNQILETIRKEIISRIDKRHLSAQANNELVSLLSFLSTLESEKPMNPDGLVNEIESYWKENGPMSHAEYDRLAKCARHFAQWGAEHLKK